MLLEEAVLLTLLLSWTLVYPLYNNKDLRISYLKLKLSPATGTVIFLRWPFDNYGSKY